MDIPLQYLFVKNIDVEVLHVLQYQRDMRFRSFFYAYFYFRQKARGGGKMRTKITLACTECKNRNYNTTKDKKTHPDRMETKKYCRFCKTHTLHKETK